MKVILTFAVSFLIFVKNEAGSEFQCALLCTRHGSCTSVNYKASTIGKGRCELNKGILKATTDDDGEKSHKFNHLVIIKPVSKEVIMLTRN